MTTDGKEPEGTASGKGKKEADSERRIHKRYTVMGCTIRYKTDSFFSRFTGVSQKYMVLDVSQSGIQFITKQKFKEQTPLFLNISAPGLNKDTIHIKGRVAWIRKSSALHIYGVGVEFVNMAEAERAKLQFLIDDTVITKSKIFDRVHLDKAEKL
jgi:Tfp pilus assembly protein PilZ